MVEGNNVTEVVVHIKELLGDERRDELIRSLKEQAGIYSADFCPLRYHLMLVDYDRERLTSGDVLSLVNKESVHAQLIGPI